MYHTYDASFNDADTAISGPIVLPVVEGEHYELDTYEYMWYGSYAVMWVLLFLSMAVLLSQC